MREARVRGIRFVVSSDAHSARALAEHPLRRRHGAAGLAHAAGRAQYARRRRVRRGGESASSPNVDLDGHLRSRSRVVLALSDCEACAAWTKDLEGFLATDREWSDLPFGKALLDQPGLVEFKRENPWLSELDALPFTQIFVHGKPAKGFAGDGIPRLVGRLRSVAAQAATS